MNFGSYHGYDHGSNNCHTYEPYDIPCILRFDGASRGNPGPAGAGAILFAEDDSIVCELRQGLGITTCNAAEYRALILGLEHALDVGYTEISIEGDSRLVCMQVLGHWQIRNPNLANLCEEVQNLMDGFDSCQIHHIPRMCNEDADRLANIAVGLRAGQIVKHCYEE